MVGYESVGSFRTVLSLSFTGVDNKTDSDPAHYLCRFASVWVRRPSWFQALMQHPNATR